MKCDSQASFLAHTFASPCLGRELKIRVTTQFNYESKYNAQAIYNKDFSLSKKRSNHKNDDPQQ
jgi:hypothetical protein